MSCKKEIMPAVFKLEAPWPEVKERLKENNLGLTDADLEYIPGREEELLDRLQKKMKKDKQLIREYIESISANTDRAS